MPEAVVSARRSEPARSRFPFYRRSRSLVDDLAAPGHGLILVMGKGGVGKTTIAACDRQRVGVTAGLPVHLSTTDPAAHVRIDARGPGPANLQVTPNRSGAREQGLRRPRDRRPRRRKDLDEEGRALLAEDLRSPCYEEVAVFGAFSRLVREARTKASSCSIPRRPVTRSCSSTRPAPITDRSSRSVQAPALGADRHAADAPARIPSTRRCFIVTARRDDPSLRGRAAPGRPATRRDRAVSRGSSTAASPRRARAIRYSDNGSPAS